MRTKQWISAVASLLLSIWSVVTFVELFLPEHPLQLALLTLPEDHYWQIGLGLAWPIVFLLIVPRWRRDHLETYSFVVALGGVVTAILHQICSNRVSLFFLDPFFLALGEIAVIGVFGWVGREVPAIRYYLWQAIIGLSLGGSLAYAITERSVAYGFVSWAFSAPSLLLLWIWFNVAMVKKQIREVPTEKKIYDGAQKTTTN